ncbi:MerR family transcriptional regulator [Neobacillus sp. PS3-12]|uniref:MerR family transcriptional regulator n=1 Tax=Neobacillus sp. PS3-12 TaxID=3070677 RepID=UPI0027DFF56C|nr:MerR family transcriptional regulator [Neobacillus sp. PS3-12]WML53081.1 MerR family transcriptional regulator [Neobacillus sp. PS3-12]
MYRIGEIAKLMDISKRTIDYYTQIGLLNPIRTDSNYRLYGEDSIRILELVEHYKNLNMPLEEIKASIELIKTDDSLDKQKVEKHFNQIAIIMQHLEEEISVMKPVLQKLNQPQKEELVRKLSTQGITLAQTLFLIFG